MKKTIEIILTLKNISVISSIYEYPYSVVKGYGQEGSYSVLIIALWSISVYLWSVQSWEGHLNLLYLCLSPLFNISSSNIMYFTKLLEELN